MDAALRITRYINSNQCAHQHENNTTSIVLRSSQPAGARPFVISFGFLLHITHHPSFGGLNRFMKCGEFCEFYCFVYYIALILLYPFWRLYLMFARLLHSIRILNRAKHFIYGFKYAITFSYVNVYIYICYINIIYCCSTVPSTNTLSWFTTRFLSPSRRRNEWWGRVNTMWTTFP